jgi:hypothetical protein
VEIRRRSRGPQRGGLLAGWLFADLFLVLFVVSLASLPPAPHVAHPPRPRHSSPPRPSLALDKPVSFVLSVQPAAIQDPSTHASADADLIAALNRQLAAGSLRGRRAGVLLVFASGPSDAINQAIATARSVIGLVRGQVPGFGRVSGQGYWSGGGDSFKFEIFFFSAQAS